MSQHALLLSLTIEHAYFNGGRTPALTFTPSRECAQMLRLMRLSLKQDENCLEVWQELADIPQANSAGNRTGDENPPQKTSSPELCFCFEIAGIDPLFSFYTDLPKAGLNFANQVLVKNEVALPIKPETEYLMAVEKPLTDKHTTHDQHSGQITVELHGVQLHTISRTIESNVITRLIHPIKRYVVALQSKQIHWKYFFSGSLAKKKLHIVDLDAEENGLGIGFVDSSLAATKDGLAMISTSAIAMRHRPSQRFQLREAGAGERILVERLPNASLTRIGKEKGRDGASLVVAEIYIHQ
jgi:hypothetical protein